MADMYEYSTIGVCLKQTVNEMVADHRLSRELGDQVLEIFDKAIVDILKTSDSRKNKLKGNILTYRNLNNVWMFIIKDLLIIKDGLEEKIEEPVKIIARDSKRPSAERFSSLDMEQSFRPFYPVGDGSTSASLIHAHSSLKEDDEIEK